MRRVWATVVGVWAVVAIVAVLAWSRAQTPSPVTGATPTVMVVKETACAAPWSAGDILEDVVCDLQPS